MCCLCPRSITAARTAYCATCTVRRHLRLCLPDLLTRPSSAFSICQLGIFTQIHRLHPRQYFK